MGPAFSFVLFSAQDVTLHEAVRRADVDVFEALFGLVVVVVVEYHVVEGHQVFAVLVAGDPFRGAAALGNAVDLPIVLIGDKVDLAVDEGHLEIMVKDDCDRHVYEQMPEQCQRCPQDCDLGVMVIKSLMNDVEIMCTEKTGQKSIRMVKEL